MSQNPQFNEIAQSAQLIARKAGNELLRYFRKSGLKVDTKLNEADIVTAADRASESIILAEIHRLYPTHSILSEESGADSHDPDWQWVIDPLDGTTNFSEGLPIFSVSIGIRHHGETVVGVVFAPYLKEMFVATAGGGATLNGTPIHCRNNSLLERAVVSTGFPVDKSTSPDNNIDNVTRILPLVRGLRRLGSAAIDLCYVAAGFLDAYWELNLHEWDVAAGELIAREAGADYRLFRTDRNISPCAATPAIFRQIFPLLSTQPKR